ncbi:Putative metallopeptidase [Kaistia soli DSM 19436]|uniref:Putative metallopeptidase n=1 Tax=Kaistia soli DSM 19436 TaxID=1122133 RepID=A0A1M4UDS6_9HYPH|nr:DUF4344 domain-containing metallopeptidase [Kaistia soli]SHE54778.1 Putative metallopeptidase [Kaistia soli DSM 19436]
MARFSIPIILAVVLASSVTASAATPLIEPKTPRAMTDDDVAEIVDFVVGNAVFALYHQAGHMVMEHEGAVPKGIGNAERAADAFAAVMLLEPRSGAGDQTMVDAIDSFKLAGADTVSIAAPNLSQLDPHAVDKSRASALVCDLVGADPEGFADIAEASGLDTAQSRLCGATWKREQTAWTTALRAIPRPVRSPAALGTRYDPADDAGAAVATILEDNRVLEEVAEKLAGRFAFAEPPSLRAETCGEPTTRYDRAANELVLCYELSTAHAHLIMRDIERRN